MAKQSKTNPNHATELDGWQVWHMGGNVVAFGQNIPTEADPDAYLLITEDFDERGYHCIVGLFEGSGDTPRRWSRRESLQDAVEWSLDMMLDGQVIDGWKASLEYPGCIVLTKAGESCEFYATPNWESSKTLAIAYDRIDAKGTSLGFQESLYYGPMVWADDISIAVQQWRAITEATIKAFLMAGKHQS